jgi:hypothetical protein
VTFRIFSGMTWPVPCGRTSDIERALRHANADAIFSMEDRLVAASIIAAYQDLIYKPIHRRNAIIKELRKGPNV